MKQQNADIGSFSDSTSNKPTEELQEGSLQTDKHRKRKRDIADMDSIASLPEKKKKKKSKQRDTKDETSTCRMPVDIHEPEHSVISLKKKKKHKKKNKEAEEGEAGHATDCSSLKGGEMATPGSNGISDTYGQELELIPGSNLGSIKGYEKSKRKDTEDESIMPVDILEPECPKKKKHKKRHKEAEEAGQAIECSSLKGGEIVTPGSDEVTGTDRQKLEHLPGSNLGSIKGYGMAEGAKPGQDINFARRKRLVRFSLEGGEIVAAGSEEVAGTDRQKLEQFPGSNLGSIKGYGN